MDALIQDTPEADIPFEKKHIATSRLHRGKSRRESRGTTTDDHNAANFALHGRTPSAGTGVRISASSRTLPTKSGEEPPRSR